jgi:hypothetical protein
MHSCSQQSKYLWNRHNVFPAVPTWAKQWPHRPDNSCAQCYGAQISSYLRTSVWCENDTCYALNRAKKHALISAALNLRDHLLKLITQILKRAVVWSMKCPREHTLSQKCIKLLRMVTTIQELLAMTLQASADSFSSCFKFIWCGFLYNANKVFHSVAQVMSMTLKIWEAMYV